MRTKSIYALLAAVALALVASAAWPQATLTRAEGKVTNAGKPLADVQVVLTYQDSGKASKVKTDKNGAFFLIGLTRGNYTVEVFNAAGENLYREKNHSLTGEGGATDKLDIDVSGPGGAGGQPKLSAEQVEAIKAQNAKATSINALIGQYQAAMAVRAELDKTYERAAADLRGKHDAAAESELSKLTEKYHVDADKTSRDAEAALKQMTAADPTRWEYFQALGTAQFNLGDYDGAVQSYDKGIQAAQGYVSGATPKDPKNANSEPAKAKAGMGQMLASEGNAYLKLKKNSEAIAAFTKAAEMDPNPGTAYFNLCATQYNSGNTEGALVACDKAIAADPNKADAYFIKGSLLIAGSTADKEGKIQAPPGTAQALNKYLELAPDGPHAKDVKDMLQYIGSKIETTYKGSKKK